jgi:hypothetical protein
MIAKKMNRIFVHSIVILPFVSLLFHSEVCDAICVQEDIRTTYSSGIRRGDHQWAEKLGLQAQPGKLRVPQAGQLENVVVEWSEPGINEIGHVCTIYGQLLVESETGERTPVDWPQLIAVHLSRSPGESSDWSRGVDSESAANETVVVNLDGKFSVDIDLREVKSGFDDNRTLQAGVSLAKQTVTAPDELRAEVGSSVPVMAKSVCMLVIPRAREQSEIIKLIDRATGWPDEDSSAVDLIRASNALRELGREQALAALEEYLKLMWNGGLNSADVNVIYGLIQCTFEPANPARKLPRPYYCFHLGGQRDSTLAALWPREPMDISNDIPWLLGGPVGGSGPPHYPGNEILWIRRYGKLRDEPMRPADNPLVVAQAIMNEPRFALLDQQIRDLAEAQLKRQSYAMVADLLPKIANDNWDRPEGERNWKMLLKESVKADIFWDESKQSYQAKEK